MAEVQTTTSEDFEGGRVKCPKCGATLTKSMVFRTVNSSAGGQPLTTATRYIKCAACKTESFWEWD